jgi:hypothetical protein
MKLRFKLVIILVCISLVTAFFLQGYWLYQTYKSISLKLDTDILDAMQTANFQEIFHRADVISKYTKPKKSRIAFNHAERNCRDTSFKFTMNVEGSSKHDTILDNLNKPLLFSNFIYKSLHSVLDTILKVDIVKYDSIFSVHLGEKKIQAKYIVRFINEKGQASDSFSKAKLPLTGGHTYRLPVDIDNTHFYELYLVTDRFHLVRQMGFTMAASLLLIIILCISFIYLKLFLNKRR